MTLGELAVAGATGLPSSVTVTSTAAEFADVSMAGVTSVLLNKPVTSDGVISSVVNCEFGVLMVVSSNVVALPFRLPGLAGPTRTTLPTHRISTNGRLGRAETFFRQDRQYFLGTSRENRHVGDYELKQSRYLIPDPVLKITTCSPMSIFPDARSFFSA